MQASFQFCMILTDIMTESQYDGLLRFFIFIVISYRAAEINH